MLVHEIPGRLRLRTRTRISPQGAQILAERLDAVAGILGVRVNPRTGSVLLYYADSASRTAACLLLSSTDCSLCICSEPVLSRHLPEPVAERPGVAPFLWHFLVRPLLPMLFRVGTAIRRAIPYFRKGMASLGQGKLNVEVLDASAIGVSLLRRDFRTASLLMLLLGFGEALEAWTRKKSLDRLAESLRLDIDTVWVERNGEELHVPIAELLPDDLVIARAGSAIPVDGVVVRGEAAVNQASMTGEPLGVLRSPGASVFAGTVVEDGEIRIRSTGTGDDTRLKQIVRYIEESEKLKAGVQGKAERLADAVVPFSFLLAGAVWLLTRDPARAASVLLVDYSCALRLATPLAILAAMREGAAHGVLIKGGRYLEALGTATTVVFDKTGTLTESRPHVADVIPTSGWERDEVLRTAACLEEHFPHPVARAVVRRAEEEGLAHREEHTSVEYVVAHGIASHLHGRRVVLGSRHYVHQDEGVPLDAMHEEVERQSGMGRSLLYLAVEGELAGIICIEDPLRREAKRVVEALRETGIRRIVMLTGDDERTATAVAASVGITEYCAGILPADKADIVKQLQQEGPVLMVGDGINDSPALSAADAGITLRDGADIAQEVAGVVLTECNLEHLLVAIRLGRATLRRIHTNFGWAVGLNTAFLAGGLSGVLTPGLSAILHNTTTIGVCMNAMRPALNNTKEPLCLNAIS